MAHGSRKLVRELRMQNRSKPLLLESSGSPLLVEEEAHLSDEADVREGDVLPHEEATLGQQRLVDSGGVRHESVARSRVALGGDAPAHQGQQVDLRIPREHETRIEEAVHPRCLVGSLAVEGEAARTQAGDRPHDAVRLEDPHPAVGAERGRHGPERMRRQEGVRLAEAGPLKAHLPDTYLCRRRGLVTRQRARVEVPQPRLELLRRGPSYLDLDPTQTRGDGRLPDARIRQVGEYPKLDHRGADPSCTGRRTRSWITVVMNGSQ